MEKDLKMRIKTQTIKYLLDFETEVDKTDSETRPRGMRLDTPVMQHVSQIAKKPKHAS